MANIKRHRNPYIAGKALTNDDIFFGREETIRKVLNIFKSSDNNLVVLYGQRRIGKTSILLKLLRSLPDPPFFSVYVDLMDKAQKTVNEALFDIATICAEKAGLDPLDKDAFIADKDTFHLKFLPKLYKKLGNRRPVFLFDEFDVMDQHEDKYSETAAANKLHPYLRQLISTQTKMCFVFVVGRRMQELSFEFLSTFKSAQSIQVFVLEVDAAKALIKKGEEEGILFEEEAINEILFLTRCHPYFTQLLCQEVFNQQLSAEGEKANHVTLQTVRDSIPAALASGGSAFQWIWKGLPPAEQIVFSAIAEKATPGCVLTDDEIMLILKQAGIRMMMKELNLAPSTLVEWKMLEKVDEGYQFYIELMRRWVAEYQPLWQVKDEIEKVNPLANTLFQAAEHYFNQKNYEKAIQQLQEAISLNPNIIKARLLLGTIYKIQEDYEHSIKEYKEAFKLDENEARYDLTYVMLRQGELYEQEGKYDDAEKIYDEILSDVYEHEEIAHERKLKLLIRKAETYINKNDFYSAYRLYMSAGLIKKAQEILDNFIMLARQQEAHDELEKAEVTYTTLISMQPEESSWQIKKSEIRQQIANIQRVKQIIAESRNLIENLHLDQARELLLKAIQIQPDNVEVISLIELVEKQIRIRGYLTEAIKDFRNKNYASSKAALEKVLQIEPSNPKAQELMQQIEIEEEVNKKLELLRSAIETKDLFRAQDILLEILEIQPNNSQALKSLSQVQSQIKANQDVAENLSQARNAFSSKDFIAAQKFLNNVLNIDPSNKEAVELQMKVNSIIFIDQENELKQLRARQSKKVPISIGVVIGIISSIATCIIGIIALASNPSLAQFFIRTPIPVATPTNQIIMASETPKIIDTLTPTTTITRQASTPDTTISSAFIFESKRFIQIPVSTAKIATGEAAPTLMAVENLQLVPGYHVLQGVPISFTHELQTQNSDHPDYPEKIDIPVHISQPQSVYFLIQSDWGLSQFGGKQIGKVIINFETAPPYEYPLVLGTNIRDWSRGNVSSAITSINSDNVVEAWLGIAPDGRSGGMDLLKVLIPEEYRNSVITSINIEDTTFQELNNYNPGIHILAVSVEIQDLTPGNWEYQVEQIPHSESSIEWELKTGELFILTGGSFSYKGYSCGGNASQICILVIKGTKSSTIRIDNLVPLNNWIAITKSLLPDEAVSSVQDEFWLSPNCGSGCTTAQVAIFSDDIQEKSYTINKP